MKLKRSDVNRQVRKMPALQFDNGSLTSCAGLVLFAELFTALALKNRVGQCFRHLPGSQSFARGLIFLQLIVHILLGYRALQDCRWYADDPLVQRVLGLKRLPTTATLSRMLKGVDAQSVERLRGLLRDLVFQRLVTLGLSRITLDFDGSVLSTQRHAQGTAVGFNKKKKGARSYYPLFCTIAQTGQVLDLLHRPGNVHDSNGAATFISACISAVRRELPGVKIEVRMDSAFFNDEIVGSLDRQGVEFTVSVPFERFTELKRLIEGQRHWRRLTQESWYFESQWKPKCWSQRFRFVFFRKWVPEPVKAPLQLDLFVPTDWDFEYKVIVTNKDLGPRPVAAFHEGRGAQEGIFAELKSDGVMEYIPVRTLCGNQTYLLAALLAHNLAREFQMRTASPDRGTTPKRSTLWVFEKLSTLRATILRRAGRLTRPGGILTLTISANVWIQHRFHHLRAALAINKAA